MTREEFAIIFKVIKASYPNYVIFQEISTVEVWYEKLKDLDYKTVMNTANTYSNMNKFPPSIADLRAGSSKTPEWSVEWFKIVKGATAVDLNEPARYALKVLTRDCIDYCLNESPNKILQCMKEFERLYNNYSVKNIPKQLMNAGLYDNIKTVPVLGQSSTNEKQVSISDFPALEPGEEIPLGVEILSDGSRDYSCVKRDWS